MKNTYTGTLFHPTLDGVRVEIDVYDKPKYEADNKKVNTVAYTNMTAWDLIQGGTEAEEIEAETDANSADPNHEYLVLHFNDGTTSTFRNSYVSMWIL